METFMSVLLALATVFAAGVYLYGLNLAKRWRYRHIPGPRPEWLLGNLREVGQKGIHKARAEWQDEHGPMFKFWLGLDVVVCVSDPDAAKKVVMKVQDKKPRTALSGLIPDCVMDVTRHILATIGAKEAKELRSAWQPVFHNASLKSYVAPMSCSARRLVRRLDGAAEVGAEVNLWRLLGDMTMDVVGRAAFGVDLNTQSNCSRFQGSADAADPSKNITAAAIEVFASGGPAGGAKNMVTLYASLLPFTRPLMRALVGALKALDRFPQSQRRFLAAIEFMSKEALRLTHEAENAKRESEGVPDVGGFLQRLAQSSKNLDSNQIAAQAFTFMLAGYETSGNTLAFAMYHIAKNPEVLAKIHEEIADFYSSTGKDPSFEDLSSFPYISAVVDETLRVSPPVTGTIPRFQAEDMELCGLTIPGGFEVQAHIMHMHHDPANFPDPEIFRPERFLKSCAKTHHPYAYMPFGGGGRMCIGMRFALEEIKLTLITILKRFEFHLSPGQEVLRLGTASTQGPAEGVFGTMTVRDSAAMH